MSPEAKSKVAYTLDSDYIGQGPRVEEFEDMLQIHLQSDVRPVTVNSGTSALDLALELIGVGPGDYVISTAQTCFASNSVIINRGANIIWADIDPVTGNIDPQSISEAIKQWEHDKRWNGDIKAVMAVNWGGRLCNYKELKSHGIPVIEDAAHTWGIPHRGVERGDYVCYSFQAIKFLTTGDGGALIPPQDKEHDARLLRWYGLDRSKGESFRCTQNIKKAGFKYHMNDIAASIGLANLNDALDSVNLHTRNAYKLALGLRDSDSIIIPPIDHLSPYWLFTIILDNYIDKDHFVDHMTNNGISTSPVHYRNDLYDATEPFQRDDLPGLDSFSSYQLNIPNGWWLSEDDINHIIKTIKNYK